MDNSFIPLKAPDFMITTFYLWEKGFQRVSRHRYIADSCQYIILCAYKNSKIMNRKT